MNLVWKPAKTANGILSVSLLPVADIMTWHIENSCFQGFHKLQKTCLAFLVPEMACDAAMHTKVGKDVDGIADKVVVQWHVDLEQIVLVYG